MPLSVRAHGPAFVTDHCRAHCRLLDLQGHPSDAPLFPDQSGGYCSKAGVVQTSRLAAQMAGMEIKDADGGYRLSGPTFRITGTRFLAAAGLDPISIQLLGRCRSNAALTHLAEAPLMSLRQRLKPLESQQLQRALHDAPLNFMIWTNVLTSRACLKPPSCWNVSLRSGGVTRQMEQQSDEFEGVSIVLESQKEETWKVVNTKSRVQHRASVLLSSSPHTWKTRCGWAFPGKKFAETLNEHATLTHA